MQIKSDARISSNHAEDTIPANGLQYGSPTEIYNKEPAKETNDTSEKYILQMRGVCAQN